MFKNSHNKNIISWYITNPSRKWWWNFTAVTILWGKPYRKIAQRHHKKCHLFIYMLYKIVSNSNGFINFVKFHTRVVNGIRTRFFIFAQHEGQTCQFNKNMIFNLTNGHHTSNPWIDVFQVVDYFLKKWHTYKCAQHKDASHNLAKPWWQLKTIFLLKKISK
jgi:hypothetical protein